MLQYLTHINVLLGFLLRLLQFLLAYLDHLYLIGNIHMEFCDRYLIFTYSCANDFDPSVTIENSGRSNSARFSFKLFLWSHNPDDPVYLHCIVSICNVTRFDEVCFVCFNALLNGDNLGLKF